MKIFFICRFFLTPRTLLPQHQIPTVVQPHGIRPPHPACWIFRNFAPPAPPLFKPRPVYSSLFSRPTCKPTNIFECSYVNSGTSNQRPQSISRDSHTVFSASQPSIVLFLIRDPIRPQVSREFTYPHLYEPKY